MPEIKKVRTVQFDICAGTRKEVVEQVNAKLRDGWEMHGDIFANVYTAYRDVYEDRSREMKSVPYQGTTFNQAMIFRVAETIEQPGPMPTPSRPKRPSKASRGSY